MSDDLGRYACFSCGHPLRYGLSGFRCHHGVVPPRADTPVGLRRGIDCLGEGVVMIRGPKPKPIELFQCSGCKVKTKWDTRIPDQKPEQYCACGGMLVFIKAQSR